MGTSPVTINPTTNQPQILGSNGQPVPTLNANGTTAGSSQPAPSAPNINYTPSATALSVLGGSVPQTSTVTSALPGQPGYQGSGYDTAQSAGYQAVGTNQDLTNNALAQQIYAGLSPQFDQQNRALNAQLAQAGIIGGSAPGAQGALNQQQQTQFQSQLAPELLQQEQLGLNQAQANAANTNTANQFTAGNQQQVNLANANAGTQNQQYNQGQRQALNLAELNNQINNNQYNTSQINQGNQTNNANTLNVANSVAQQYQGQQAAADAAAQQNYANQLQLWGQLAQGQAAGVSQAYNPINYQPPAVNLSGLSQSLATAPKVAPASTPLAVPATGTQAVGQ